MQLVSGDPEFQPWHRNTRQGRMLATLDLFIQSLRWDKSPRHIVASSTLKNSASYMNCVHSLLHSIFHSIVPFHTPVKCLAKSLMSNRINLKKGKFQVSNLYVTSAIAAMNYSNGTPGNTLWIINSMQCILTCRDKLAKAQNKSFAVKITISATKII